MLRQTILSLFILCALAAPARAIETSAKQAFVIDYDTGVVLLEKNPDERMPTSSMSKVMTMAVVFDALKNGKLKMDDTLPVSEKAWRMQGSKMFVHVGDKVKVEDLIRGVIVQSGNDATIVLAEGLSGTEETFAEAMNVKAAQIGMNNSHFMNASGWPDPEHYSTARDLATLASYLIRTFPDYYHFYSQIDYTYNNIKQGNRNPLLYRNVGADGIKTGHTEAAGYGLIGSAVKNGRRVIMVVNGLENDKKRAEEATRLISWGLSAFENTVLFKPGDPVEKVAVELGKLSTVPVTVDKEIKVTVPVNFKNDLKTEIVIAPVKAPVKKGQQLGTLKVSVPQQQPFEVPLLAAQDVEKLGFFSATMARILMMIDKGS